MRLKDHLNKLEYFRIVVDSGSLKKASEKAFVGQPQLSKVIKQLEDILNVKLLYRSVKGVIPTLEGKKLYDFAKEVIELAEKSELRIKSGLSAIKGTIRIGTYDSIARYFFPDFLNYLESTVPDLNIFLKTGKSSAMIKDLQNKNLDIAIVVFSKKPPSNLISEVIYNDSFGLYCSPQINQNFKDKLIYFDFESNDVHGSIQRFKFKDAFNCDNLETVKSLTERGMGVGLLPHRVAKEGAIQKKLETYQHPKIKLNKFDSHDITLCYQASKLSVEESFILEELKRFLSVRSESYVR